MIVDIQIEADDEENNKDNEIKVCPQCGNEELDSHGYCLSCGTCSVCGQTHEDCTCGTTTCPLCGSELEGNAEEGEDVFCTNENCSWGTDVYWDCPDCGLPTLTDSFDGLVSTCARCGYTVE